jgi:hypothetical protein
MDPLKHPEIDYETKRGRSIVIPVSYSISPGYTLTIERVRELRDELKGDIAQIASEVDLAMLPVALKLPDGAGRSAMIRFSRTGYEPSILTYTAYLTALSSSMQEAEYIRDTYRDWNLTQWGNSLVVGAELIQQVSIEVERIGSFLDSVESITEDTLIALAGAFGKIGIVVDEIRRLTKTGGLAEALNDEISSYSRQQRVDTQALIADRVDDLAATVDRSRSQAIAMIDVIGENSFSSSVKATGASGVTSPSSGGILGSAMTELATSANNNRSNALTEFSVAITRFMESAVEMLDAAGDIRTFQAINSQIISTGGVSSADVSPIETVGATAKDHEPFVTTNISSSNVAESFIIRQQIESEINVDAFVAVEDFEFLKGLLFFPGTTKIDGNSIQTGTIDVGAIKIGDRPIILNVLWGENQTVAGSTNSEVLGHLAISAGTCVVNRDGTIIGFIISAAEIKLEDQVTSIDVQGNIYWIYLSLDNPADGLATVFGRLYDDNQDNNNRPDGENIVVLGLWEVDTVEGRGRLTTSYGTTVINGNSIITGTVVADLVRIGGTTTTARDIKQAIYYSNYISPLTVFDKAAILKMLNDAMAFKDKIEANGIVQAEVAGIKELKDLYDIAYADLQEIQTLASGGELIYDILTDVITTVSASDINELNSRIQTYNTCSSNIIIALENYFTNANSSVTITSEGILVGNTSGLNSLLSADALVFKYAADERVSIGATHADITEAKLHGAALFPEDITIGVPPTDETTGTLKIQRISTGFNIDFL